MKIENPFKRLTKFEKILYLVSLGVTLVTHFANPKSGTLNMVTSLIGATALIFTAKGDIIGPIISLAFALLYGYISLSCHYYGEMITYVFMSAPMATFSIITWFKNPYKSNEVKIRKRLSALDIGVMSIATALVTAIFFFILRYLNTAKLILSTFSVTTSFLACWLTMLRSPFYALAYAANDLVLIGLWISASIKDISYLPMVGCFVVFLANDLYGFFNWVRMSKKQ